MILAAGLTPALQQIVVLESFSTGEVNRAVETRWCASGKVLNVGIALEHLGVASRTLSLLGRRADSYIEHELATLDISCRWIRTVAPTRICTTILDRATGRSTELVENAAAVTADELDRFADAFAEEARDSRAVVLTGSMPAGTPRDFYARLLATTTAPVVLDVRGPELHAALEHRPLLIKPNVVELAHTLSCSAEVLAEDDDALIAACRELIERGAQWTLITRGSRPALLCSAAAAYELVPPRLDSVVNAIGSGDCAAAAFAWAITGGHDVPDACRHALAAGTLNARVLLPGRLSAADVTAWAQRVECRRV
ncbi:MAG: PfkB family carbohydrate kinase [Pirellulales bacterium]|nr:bifunctional hydroxymethylpyrimidine kinase/phosphomethylpyrimidine kinase [Planctomycetales bacterium]